MSTQPPPQSETAATTPTQSIPIGADHIVYRRLGPPTGIPLVCLQHFRGSLDSWDPALLDGLARERPVITFDNIGVGRSSGSVPATVAAMAESAMAFIAALGMPQVDLLGFSLGGYIAQSIALTRPDLIRRLILAGTGAGKGAGSQDLSVDILTAASGAYTKEGTLALFFAPTPASQAAGAAFWERLQTRQEDPDPFLAGPGVQAQRTALLSWDDPAHAAFPRLGDIQHPVFVAGGSHDLIIPTANAIALAQHLPNALLTIYPDSGHGFLFQHHDLFVTHATRFLQG